MKKNRKERFFGLRGLCVMLCAMLIVSILPASTLAIDKIDEARVCSLTVEYSAGGAAADGAMFKLYRVAEMTDFGTFTLTGQFANDPIEVNDLDAAGWDELAKTLEYYVDSENRQPDKQQIILDGKTVFADLPVGLYLVVSDTYVADDVLYLTQPVIVSLPNHSDPADGDAWVYDVTIQPKAGEFESGLITVRKIWKNDTASNRPKSININLLIDGEVYDSVTLNRSNDWEAVFSKELPSGANWTIKESPVPEGYKCSWDWEYDGERIWITVKNTKDVPKDDPDLPQTGQLWWPVPVLAVAGMMLFASGWLRRRQYEE